MSNRVQSSIRAIVVGAVGTALAAWSPTADAAERTVLVEHFTNYR